MLNININETRNTKKFEVDNERLLSTNKKTNIKNKFEVTIVEN